MCLLLLFAAAAMGWEIPPPPDLPPPPPPLPSTTVSPGLSECHHSQDPVLSFPGDAVLIALLNLRTGSDCGSVVTEGSKQMAALAAVGSALSRREFASQMRVGLSILDTCSSPSIAQKALVSELVFLECNKSYPLGVLAAKSTENAVSSVAVGAKQRVLRLPPPLSSPSSSSSNRENGLLEAAVALMDSTWSTVSLWVAPSFDHHLDWLSSVTREKGICLINSSASKRNATDSDAIVVIGAINNGLEPLVRKAAQEHRAGQPLLLIPLDGVLSDAVVVPDDAMVLVPTTEDLLRLADFNKKNDSDYIERVAAAAGLRLFVEVAKSVLRQIDGLEEVVMRKCKGQGVCSELPHSTALPNPPVKTDEQILSFLRVRQTDIERGSLKTNYELRQGNAIVGRFMDGAWSLKASIPIPEANLLCDSGHESRGRRDCSKCWNFQTISASAAEAAIVDHTVHLVAVNGEEGDVYETTSATGPTIVAAPDSNLAIQWRYEESWVAAVVTVSTVGSASAFAIAGFMAARILKGDILEGNPCASFVLLFAVVLAYAAVLPFCVTIPGSNRGPWRDFLCAARIFGTSTAYGQMFAVMLARALMLASCDRDGGFLTHVSGYVQSSVCIALGSVPLWAVAAAIMSGPATCASLANGRLHALLLGYDLLLLVLLVASTPFIATSKRNYREGAFFSAAAALCVSVWAAWWALYLSLPARWHDAAAAGGLSGTATAVLLTVFIPRTYMMMTAVVRDRLSSALPSLAYSTAGSGLIGGPMYYDSSAEPGPARRDMDETPGASGTFRNAYRANSPRNPRALSPHDVTYERYESPNSPLKVTRF